MATNLDRSAFLVAAIAMTFAASVRAQDPPPAPKDAAPAPQPKPAPQPQPKPAAAAPALVLPETIDAATLRRALAETPPTIAVFDVRPAWQFAEFHVPGAVNVAAADAAAKIAALPAGTRAVVVDRDGTTAFAVAVLARPADGTRSVLVLTGGTREWWRDSNSGSATSAPASKAPADAPKPAQTKRPAGC